jgi:hypothetical protein
MDQGKLHTAVQALLDLFGDDVPQGFSHEGQTFGERAESWIRHAVDALEQEVADFQETEGS